MARLRVGDIEIDGTQVRVGSSAMVPAAATGTRQRIAAPPGLQRHPLSWLPIPAAWLAGMGGVVFAAGAIRLALTSGPLDVANIVSRGAFLLPLGLGLVLLAGLKALAGRGLLLPTADDRADPGTLEHLAQLREVLGGAQRHTVPTLSQRLGWPESDVVRALGWLRAAGDVDEEIDMTSGDFHYVLVARPQDLATRLRHLQETDRA